MLFSTFQVIVHNNTLSIPNNNIPLLTHISYNNSNNTISFNNILEHLEDIRPAERPQWPLDILPIIRPLLICHALVDPGPLILLPRQLLRDTQN